MQYLSKISFSDFVSQDDAKLAFILNAIEPSCGGVLLVGKKGTGKSTLLRAFRDIAFFLNIPFIEVPMNATEEAVLGSIDIENTIKKGERIYQRGLLSKADKGFLCIEDINLFPHYILSLIFEVQSKQQNIIEREGVSLSESTKFSVLATMNPEEASLSAHFLDRFGMCVVMDEISDKEKKKEIIKLNIGQKNHTKADELIKSILKSKEFIKEVKLSDEINQYTAELTLKEAIRSHRADIFLVYASKAYAAYLEEEFVKKEHVERVAPFVLIHRKRLIELQPKQHENKDEKNEQKQNKIKDFQQSKIYEKPSQQKEEVFPVGEGYKVKRILLKKDRLLRDAFGRRTKTKTKAKGGRFIRSLIQKRHDIAVDATLRAAAPFQIIRGKTDHLIIKEEDLRYKEKERKMRHTVVFVVDGSGSMAVNQRMIATKGAVFSLLMDCYQKKDKVSMILFRKDKAETILPPTSSYNLAVKRLKEIPTGGKTPLSAGLIELYKLIRRMIIKEPESRFLTFLLTDGKANVAVTEKSIFEELQSICCMLKKLPMVDFIVIDTEKKNNFIKIDAAFKVSEWLSAKYFLMDDLKTESLLSIVKTYKFQ